MEGGREALPTAENNREKIRGKQDPCDSLLSAAAETEDQKQKEAAGIV